MLLPDLRTLPPSDLEIVSFSRDARELRLSNTIWNSGEGPLELEGVHDPSSEKTSVKQHIYSAQPDGNLSRPVGDYVWHPTHDHWHYEGFSIYELWMVSPDGRLGELVRSSDKVSYCVIDTGIVDREIEGFLPYRTYRGCGQTLQGLTVGWGDTYKSFLDGQSITLAGVEDGLYALKSTVNPDAILLESNYQNNTALVFLEIRGKKITMIDPVEYFHPRCLYDSEGVVRSIYCGT